MNEIQIQQKEKKGAEIVVECLKKLGVATIFGYPGGAILPIYDALCNSDIEHVLTKHEQAAIHAAQGYARASGKVGTVIATSGPGATNLVTGIADAYMDSTPLVIITGQVPTDMIGRDAFQEVCITEITMGITKHNYRIQEVSELPRVMMEAYYLASTGRPGPVLVDIPKDIANQWAVFELSKEVSIRGYRPNIEPDRKMMKEVCEAISASKRPLLYIGGGIISAGASEELCVLARKTGIPVVSTLMGLGVFPPDDPLFMGMLGMHGTYAANKGVSNCDLLIACGVRFDDRVTGKFESFSAHSKKIHIDIDPSELNKNVPVDYPVEADVKTVLQILIENVPSLECNDWLDQLKSWDAEYQMSSKEEPDSMKPQTVLSFINEITNGEAIVTTDVGQHQMWAAHYCKAYKPRTFITSGGLGTMGYGLPAAIGAKLACPEKTVISITGDASFQMNIQELQTIYERDLSIKIFVINNGYLGLVRQLQEFFYDNRVYQAQIGSPDFVKVAEAYNIKGLTARTANEAKMVIEEAFNYPGPVVVNLMVKEDENVFPMVPPGATNEEMIMED